MIRIPAPGYLPSVRSEPIHGSQNPGEGMAAQGLVTTNTVGPLQPQFIATGARCIRMLTESIAANGHPPH